jgi:anti-sigma factor RsiW
MRGKLSDQDLTNYALNDGLDPGERLYVESLLAVSEECREDIYAMIDLGQMLEEGLEQEADRAERLPALTAEQRNVLLDVQEPHPAWFFVRKAAAVLAMAALLGFAVANPMGLGSRSKIARVSSKVSQMVNQVVGSGTNQDADAFVSLVDLHELVDDSSSWVQTANDTVQPSASTCTPPSWNPEISSIH